jgi:5-oxopent-3-ene-1,2,5-tricarboxylate decarboxylase/2-hydroxyhepta-2,4-diene-1,7-dioate isomerase
MTTLDPDLRARLECAPVAALSQQLRRRGLDHVTIDGVRPIGAARKLVGVARTLRFVPFREDLFDEHGGGYNVQKQTFDSVDADEVIVIEARGVVDAGTLGDVLAWRAHTRGAAGIVSDGGVRDADAVGAIGIPVFAAGPHPAVLGRRHVPWDAQLAVACGGATVRPGDIIVGDADGVIVIPPLIASEVVDDALAQESLDVWVVERVKEGHAIEGLFPPNDHWRARFDAEQDGTTDHAR